MAVFAKKRRTVFEIIRDTKLVPEDKLNKLEEDSKPPCFVPFPRNGK